MTVIATDRLLIREWTDDPADLARIFDIYSRWEVRRWLGVAPTVLTEPAEALALLHRWRRRHARDAGRLGTWAVQVRRTGVVAGTVLLNRLPGRDGRPGDEIEVGWHLHPDSWGHGYATEAARAVVGHALAGGAERVYAATKPDNHRSMAVAHRLGMTPLGRIDRWYGGLPLEGFVLPAP